MGWESKVFNQILSCSCIFKNNTPSWMPLVALLMLFSSYLLVGFGYFSILYTSLVVLVFSTVFYTVRSKHKAAVVEVDDELVEEKVLKPEEEATSDQRGNIAPAPLHKLEEKERVAKEKEAEEDAANYSATSPDLISESDEFHEDKYLSTSEEASEVDWPIRYVVDHSPDECSDGSISDEESLIEIALPSGHYVDHHQNQQQKLDEPRYNCRLQQRKALFSHHSLMEFLSELNDVNEEENLIEIDISIGSIKYSRFEIEA